MSPSKAHSAVRNVLLEKINESVYYMPRREFRFYSINNKSRNHDLLGTLLYRRFSYAQNH